MSGFASTWGRRCPKSGIVTAILSSAGYLLGHLGGEALTELCVCTAHARLLASALQHRTTETTLGLHLWLLAVLAPKNLTAHPGYIYIYIFIYFYFFSPFI